jgi:hypothetical protein
MDTDYVLSKVQTEAYETNDIELRGSHRDAVADSSLLGCDIMLFSEEQKIH